MRLVTLAILLSLLTAGSAAAKWFFEAESGIAISGYNDVRIPGDTGTEFSLSEDLSTDSRAFGRFRLGYLFGDRHHLSGFYAPLRLSAAGTLPKDVFFQDTEFQQGSIVDGTYRFDSYRLTYRYRVYRGETFRAWLGLTAKIRDAEVALESADLEAKKTNTGFVPLLSFRLDWKLSRTAGVLLEGDALAGGPGRAEDVFLGLGWDASPWLLLKGGYRILEGGADVDEVYNFTLIHFVSLGGVIRF